MRDGLGGRGFGGGSSATGSGRTSIVTSVSVGGEVIIKKELAANGGGYSVDDDDDDDDMDDDEDDRAPRVDIEQINLISSDSEADEGHDDDGGVAASNGAATGSSRSHSHHNHHLALRPMRLDAREHVERSRGAIALAEKAPPPQSQSQLPERRDKQAAVKADPDTDESATGGLFVPLVDGEERDTVTEVGAEIGGRRSGQEQDGGSGTTAVVEPVSGDVGSGQASSSPPLPPPSSSVQVARMVGGDVRGKFDSFSSTPPPPNLRFSILFQYFYVIFFLKKSPNALISRFTGQRDK
jgi:hypothetical protein